MEGRYFLQGSFLMRCFCGLLKEVVQGGAVRGVAEGRGSGSGEADKCGFR